MLKFIGSGSAFNTALGNNSAYYKKASSLFLIDCGSSVFSRIRRFDLLDNINKLYILITHLHPDHVASLGDLIFYVFYAMKMKAVVFTPDTENLSQLLKYMGVKDEVYDLIKLEGEHEIIDENLQINVQAYRTIHSESLNSYGYLMNMEGSKLFYSGDCREIPADIIKMLEQGCLDRIYQDTCSYDFDDNPHMSFDRLCVTIGRELRSKVYCMHLDEDFDRTKALEQGFNVVRNEFI